MKKIYALFAGLTISLAAAAQCTPNPSLFGAANNTNYSIIPDTITNLPLAYVGVGYNTDLQFHIQPDTVTQLGTFPIVQVQIDSVTGIPAGFSYIPNPANGTFTTPTNNPPGTGYGCVAVTGTATAGQELGGPNNDGIYPITVYYTATVIVFSVPTPFPTTKTGYKLVILPANGVPAVESLKFGVSQNNPNPSDLNTEFRVNSPNSGNVQVTVYDILGSVVRQENLSVAKGSNRYQVETGTLADGVYLCTFRMGSAVVTKRISVSH